MATSMEMRLPKTTQEGIGPDAKAIQDRSPTQIMVLLPKRQPPIGLGTLGRRGQI